MKKLTQHYIGGQWVDSHGTDVHQVINPATEEVIAEVNLGDASDVDAAVAAARAAFDSWSATSADVRAKYCRDISAALASREEELTTTISQELGAPVVPAKLIQAGLGISDWNNYAEVIENYQLEEQVGTTTVVKEPIGVVGAITPWNYPLYLIVCKVAPAIASGCTVVLKPSEVTPLNAFILAEAIHEAGLPAGVFNLVVGNGPVVGAAISGHNDVDMVSFTGSGPSGAAIQKAAAGNFKRVHLELGGKSANIILDDTDFESIVSGVAFASFINSGQTCSAKTRLLVPAERHDEIVDRLAQEVAACRLVDPTVEDWDLFHTYGPLVTKAQQDRVRGYIQKGIDEGATLVVGGPEQPQEQPNGWYVKPTLFANVKPDMTIAQEEIFGPVLSVIPYTDEDDAVEIANNTIYGLSGSVYSADQERAVRVARRLRTGEVDVNGAPYNPVAPFGGYKQSGQGRERGRFAVDEYFETKAINLPSAL